MHHSEAIDCGSHTGNNEVVIPNTHCVSFGQPLYGSSFASTYPWSAWLWRYKRNDWNFDLYGTHILRIPKRLLRRRTHSWNPLFGEYISQKWLSLGSLLALIQSTLTISHPFQKHRILWTRFRILQAITQDVLRQELPMKTVFLWMFSRRK